MKYIIIDDDQTSRFVLQKQLEKINSIQLAGICENTYQARTLLKNQTVDLIFLDIEMPLETGVEFLDAVDNNFDVIFITAKTNHAIKAFEKDAIDYIVKPFTLERLKLSVDKAFRRRGASFTASKIEYLVIKKGTNFIKVLFDNVLYLEAQSGMITYHLKDEIIIENNVMKQIEPNLNNEVFIRVHRAYIVNIHNIKEIADRESVILTNNKELPLSRNYRRNVLKRFNTINRSNR